MKQLLAVFAVFILPFCSLQAGNTTAVFQPSDLGIGPFPSNALTITATNQKTGIQVKLPATPCTAGFAGSLCGDTAQLNNLDGFSVNPRTMVCFSGPIDPGTLKDAISYAPADGSAPAIGVNQIYYDPATNCAFAKPDQVLGQQTSYFLAVTDSITDKDGQKVKGSKEFKDCVKKSSSAYCVGLSKTLDRLGQKMEGDGDGKVVVASLFTTMSATTWLEQARQFVDTHQPPVVLPAGATSVFQLSNLQSMTWLPQDNGSAPTPTAVDLPLSALSNVESIAFGLFLSPNFLNVSGPQAGSITSTPSGVNAVAPIAVPGLPSGLPPGYVPVSFHVFLPPAATKPTGGFPVVIFGHGMGDHQFGASTFLASTLASQGFATLSLEIFGHGFGPGGLVQMTDKSSGATWTVSTPGRGIAFSAGPIGPTDGCILPGALAVRDCARQTAVDLFALVRTLQEASGMGYLDPSRIYYVGQSFGGTYGALFHAVEPSVSAAVLNSSGGSSVDVARLAISGRPLGMEYLNSANPALFNVPPAAPQGYYHDLFNEGFVMRDMPPVVNSIAGAPAIRAAFETADWLGVSGDPLAYAPHFKTSPLAGVPAKRTLFQFGFGDLEVPNPTESALVRAAAGQSSTWFLRFDLAATTNPELLRVQMPGVPLPILPHRFLSNPTISSVPAETSIAVAAQQQVASFFAGDANPNPNQFLTAPFSPQMPIFFQTGTALPEQLNFLQIPQ